ncbi:MAG TPA: glycosyltransferase [Acidimicrobiia bacterium]|nr:glycosyltransferase [Acidimicrobiia bacterium]
MRKTGADSAFNGGDAASRYLVDLTADRAGYRPSPVPAGLVELAQRHGLIPLLARHSDDSLVRAIHARESSRMRILQDHLGEVLRDLHGAGVRTAVLKGPAIASRYEDPTLRPFSDLDLLVPDSEVDLALDVLRDYPATLNVPQKRPKADKRDVLIRDETGIRFNLDLHWDLFSYSQLRGSAEGATEAAWEEARFEGDSPLGPLWELPSGYQLAFLATHAVLDHRFRLILFRDFLEITRGEPDWIGADEVAKAWGLRSTSYMALWLARRVLGADVPDEVLTSIRPRSLSVSFLEWALTRVDLVRFDGHRPHPVNLAAVLLNDSRRERVSLLLRAPSAFPGWRRRVIAETRLAAPRALILASTDRRRGAEVFTERLREGLLTRGWLVEAVSLRGYGDLPRAALEPLVTQNSGVGRRFDPQVFQALRSKTRSFKPDVVVANGGATLRYAVADNAFQKYELVYMGIGEPDYWIRSRMSRWLNRLLLRRADKILTVSEATRSQTVRLEPRVAEMIETVYAGVPDELFRIVRSEPMGPLRVLVVGSLSNEKDPELALHAMNSLPGTHVRFVGEGPMRAKLESLAQALRIDERVEFTGSVAAVLPHLEWAHVLLLTSRSEGLPGAILEASAAGIPTVSVDVGGVREAVVDGRGGYVTERSTEAIVEALRRLDEDRQLLVKMGEAARDYARQNFQIDDVIDRYAEILRSLAS